MAKVPVYDQSVGQSAGQIALPTLSPEPAAAFPTNVGEAQARLGNMVAGIGDKLAEHVIERHKMTLEQDTLDAATAYNAQLQQRLMSSEPGKIKRPDGTEIEGPTGYLNREGRLAEGATSDLAQWEAQSRAPILKNLTTDSQRMAFSRLANSAFESARHQVASHEAQQGRESYINSVKANIDSQVQLAGGVTKYDNVAEMAGNAAAWNARLANRLGLDEESARVSEQVVKDKIFAAAVEGNLDRNVAASKSILEAAKDHLSPTTFAKLSDAVAGKELAQIGEDAFQATRGMVNALGEPEYAKARDYVMKLDLNPDKKQAVWNSVMSDLKYEHALSLQQREQNHTMLENDAMRLLKQGRPLAEVMPLAVKYARHIEVNGESGPAPYEVEANKAFIAKMATEPAAQTDPVAFMRVWNSVANGGGSLTEINDLLAKKQVNAQDYSLLTKQYLQFQEGKLGADSKLQQERIDALADGLSKTDKAQFLAVAARKNFGQPVETWYKNAEALIAGDQNTGFLGFGQKQIWREALTDSDKVPWDQRPSQHPIGLPLDLTKTMQEFGDVRPGSANYASVRSAMKFLNENGKPVDDANIHHLLKSYPMMFGVKNEK